MNRRRVSFMFFIYVPRRMHCISTGDRRTVVKITAIFVLAAILITVAFAGARAAQTKPANHNVTQADMDRWKKELSNWGRWGKDDEKGTLNLVTPAKRKQAAALVKEGVSVSLARDAATE